VLGVELPRGAPVQKEHALVHELLHARGGERVEDRRLREQRTLVELDDALEVRRLRGEVARQLAYEVLSVLEAEQPVEAALEADRGAGLLAHAGPAAERAADVAGPGFREVVELEQAVE
jgi:hypothetical protein